MTKQLTLERHPQNPLFGAKAEHPWECRFVFNPAVVYDGNLFHMLYRAQGNDMVSRMGYAISIDGVHFNRLETPVFCPQTQEELYGVEDPRLTWLEGKYYMTYTAYSPTNVKVSVASTTDFLHWTRYGVVLPQHPNKDAVLFPKKIQGRYMMLHRVPPDIWVAYSDDLIHWGDYQSIVSPRVGYWDNLKVGAGAPPVETPYGWLLLYHGVEDKPIAERPTYRLGFLLLDLHNPEKVLRRSEAPVLEPMKEWEIFGGIPNVVFSDAMVEYQDQYYVYYGAADNFIALATVSRAKAWEWCKG